MSEFRDLYSKITSQIVADLGPPGGRGTRTIRMPYRQFANGISITRSFSSNSLPTPLKRRT